MSDCRFIEGDCLDVPRTPPAGPVDAAGELDRQQIELGGKLAELDRLRAGPGGPFVLISAARHRLLEAIAARMAPPAGSPEPR